MFGLGTTELLIIAFILVLLFGLGKLPHAAKQLGLGVKSFQDSVRGNDEEPATLEDKSADRVTREAAVSHEERVDTKA
ncbi:twin-arginine translocase TatA/TatE family subunit [Lujinxingia litoralis]|uniref:Sec-independent protein translocase protein TatA n=1 Tax=Lujinxingia litoralis TaxID=2211119 RepID=A0A328CBT9_9DELT|nr:twin-arginine translocase TatA/TatE family subunit [Lujinxingia litoralis]RAL25488.1 twin-arginine translocase TatA/TatE family subunit [Lujinxingia litoralis]